jgi:two-component system sensor histidine kinase YesM
VSVGEEISLLNDYLYIQKIRFKDRLDYSVQVQSETYDALLPRFSIQPLVENAIKYGFDESQELCRVEIRVERVEEFLEVRIGDSGRGMNSACKAESGIGIGLGNLRQRMSLIYGESASMELGSKEGLGTVITLRMPFRTGEKRQE